MQLVDLSEYVIVVDEAHLLQDYTSMQNKMEVHKNLLRLIKDAKTVIFMSATPKSEIRLFPFKVMEFVKRQLIALDIQLHPVTYGSGKGSKENARYTYMNGVVAEQSRNTKCLVFSNKFYNKWIDYGMGKLDYRFFHSRNKDEEWVECVLNENRTETNLTLATNYLGVGVEIKNEEEVHIFFDLNEGWDINFIVQSLGRPRDAQKIVLHLFYTDADTTSNTWFKNEDFETLRKTLKTAFRHLIKMDNDEPVINLLAARMTGVYDSLFNQGEGNERVEILDINRIIDEYSCMTIFDLDLLKQRLAFDKIKVTENEVVMLLTKDRERIKTEESGLCDMLCSRTNEWWEGVLRRTNDEILSDPDLCYKNKVNASKLLSTCKKIWLNGFDLQQTREYFGSLSVAEKIIGYLNQYCKVRAGSASLEHFDGAEKTKEQFDKEFSIVEKVFNKKYIDYRIDMKLAHIPLRKTSLQLFEYDDILKEFYCFESNSDLCVDDDIPDPFVGPSYKECMKGNKEEIAKMNGKIGGKRSSSKKPMSIKSKETGEVKTFSSREECMHYLNISSRTFSKFRKGGGIKKIPDWIPVEVVEGELGCAS